MDSWLLRFPAVGELLLAMATIPVVLVGVHLAAVRALMEIGQALCSAVWETVRPSNRAATGSPLFEQRLARPRNILITGASSGIGRALAVKYSAPGVVLVLGGRNAKRLNEVSKACRERGAKVEILNVDISSDSAEFERQLLAIDSKYPLDLLVANAGVNGRTLLGAGSISGDARAHTAVESAPEMFFVEAMKPIVQVNMVGAVATFQPLLGRFIKRGRGQIAIVSSLAGIVRNMPTAPTYCAAKTGLVALAASLRQPLFMRHNVRMNVICPGFVDTPMVDGAALETGMRRLLSFAAPRLSADEAAGCIQLGLERDVPLIAFPFVTYATLSLLTALPYGVQQTLSGVLWRWGCLPSDEI